MSLSWRRNDAGKTGRPSGSGRPLFAVAALHVEILEDRLAPSAASPLNPQLPKPTHGVGTIGIDIALVPKTGAVKPRGFTFNGLGPIQTGPVILAIVGQPAALKNVPLVPTQARPIDPGGGGLHSIAFDPQLQTANSIVHTSFWQAGEHAVPPEDDSWLEELIRAKKSLMPANVDAQPPTVPAKEGTDTPVSGPYEDSETDSAPQDSGCATNDTCVSPAMREQVACRLVMQARPGYVIALVLLISWTACERDQRRGDRQAGRFASSRSSGKDHPRMYPEYRPRPARAPPAWGTAWGIVKGRPRGLPFFFHRKSNAVRACG